MPAALHLYDVGHRVDGISVVEIDRHRPLCLAILLQEAKQASNAFLIHGKITLGQPSPVIVTLVTEVD